VPVEQDPISYTVTIDNDGEIRASGVNVRFLVDDVEVSYDTVSVDVDSPVQVRFTWMSVAGDHDIRFEVATDSLDFVQTVDANTPPTVDIGVLTIGKPVTKYKTGKEITFQANSGDANDDDLSYAWNFGDGVTSFMENPTHVYTKAGTYTVTLTVTDSRGGTFSDTFEVVVTKPDADDSPGFGALLAASAMLLALLGAASRRRRH
jgi:PKD repeat protein